MGKLKLWHFEALVGAGVGIWAGGTGSFLSGGPMGVVFGAIGGALGGLFLTFLVKTFGLRVEY